MSIKTFTFTVCTNAETMRDYALGSVEAGKLREEMTDLDVAEVTVLYIRTVTHSLLGCHVTEDVFEVRDFTAWHGGRFSRHNSGVVINHEGEMSSAEKATAEAVVSAALREADRKCLLFARHAVEENRRFNAENA